MADLDISDNNASNIRPIRTNATQDFTAGQQVVLRNIQTMKTHLLANGYTATNLAVMTKNDLVYALTVNAAFNAL